MSNHFSMGAINKLINQYEYPKIANKINKYKCPFCEKDVIFRNGKIKQPHFAHYKSNNPCSYYEKPNESQIHKDAKLLMKTLLCNKQRFIIEKKCNYCYSNGHPFNYSIIYEIFSNEYTENTTACIEYKFKYNNSNKSADVALIENDKIKYIFEICHKNKTLENNRPEPWFEINADYLINTINSGKNTDENGNIYLECIRHYKCISCKHNEEYKRKQYNDYLENIQIKKREQELEKNELLLMGKEDSRSIEIKIKIELEKENERIRRKNEYKEIEKQRKKIEEETQLLIKKKKKELEEQQKRIDEYNKNLIHLNKVCYICNINYCKCLKSKFIKVEYNLIKCSSCNKRRCNCIRITDFFKKNI
jgi:hypothetical protein